MGRWGKGGNGALLPCKLSSLPLKPSSMGRAYKERGSKGRKGNLRAPSSHAVPLPLMLSPPGLLEKLRQQPPHAPAGVKSLSEAKGKGVDHCHTPSPHRPALHGRCADPRQSVRAGWDGSVDPCWPAWRRCSTPPVTRCARDTLPMEEGL